MSEKATIQVHTTRELRDALDQLREVQGFPSLSSYCNKVLSDFVAEQPKKKR